MTADIGTIASALLVFTGSALLAALLIALLFPVMTRWIRGLPPATRAAFLLTFACAPALGGLALLILTLSPSLSHLLGLGTDHCQVHGHHAHFCLVHAPLLAGTDLERLILCAFGIVILFLGATVAIRFKRLQCVLRALLTARVRESTRNPYRVVDSPTAFALTAGLVRPEIYLSTRLLSQLSPAQLKVVLDHERTHCRRRDALRMFIAEFLSRLHLPPVRRRLLADLHLASEQACDEQAALSVRDRLRVAETILRVVRLSAGGRRSSDILLPTVTGSDVQARVYALLRPAPTPSGRPRLAALLGISLLCAFGFVHAEGLHHAVESAIHLLID